MQFGKLLQEAIFSGLCCAVRKRTFLSEGEKNNIPFTALFFPFESLEA
jgi:hypothetical protein